MVTQTQSITLALDVMGGDLAPQSVLRGAEIVIKRCQQANKKPPHFLLFGDEMKITPFLDKLPLLQSFSQIGQTDKVVSNTDKPSTVIRKGRDTSMALAIQSVVDARAQAVVSAGNTGALMALAMRGMRLIDGIDRPAIAAPMPARQGGKCIVLDLGANIEASAQMLVQFAVMGGVYARHVLELENPRIGLVNVGSEDQKGSASIKEAADLLRKVPLAGDFIGFAEGYDMARGNVDVAVTDGFTGNVLLKTAEGTASLISDKFRRMRHGHIFKRLAFWLASPALAMLKHDIDPRKYNGAMFLGLNGICVKSHGGSDSTANATAIEVALNLAEHNYNQHVAQDLPKALAVLQDALVDMAAASDT